MPQKCSICQHPRRSEIDAAAVTGEPLRKIAKRFAVSYSALYRHSKKHIPKQLLKATEIREVTQADELLRRAKGYEAKAVQLLKQAEQAEDFGTALRGVREARGCLELYAKLRGDLEEGNKVTVNILNNPQWIEIKAVILSALSPYPEAKAAVRKALTDGHGS